MENNKCKLCGYEWKPRQDKAKSCPRCKRYDWEEVKNGEETCN